MPKNEELRALILANAPHDMGAVERVNHPDCPAGVDTKRRLAIMRTAWGIWAHCWHCGNRYAESDACLPLEALARAMDGATAEVLEMEAITPVTARTMWDEMSRPGTHGLPGTPLGAWLIGKNAMHAVNKLRVSVHSDGLEVRVPVVQRVLHAGIVHTVVTGYQARNFPSIQGARKYSHVRWIYGGTPALLGHGDGPIYIVESFIDAAHIVAAGGRAVPLYSQGLARKHWPGIATQAREAGAIIWLDNDSLEIRNAAQTLARDGALYLSTAVADFPGPPTALTVQLLANLMGDI